METNDESLLSQPARLVGTVVADRYRVTALMSEGSSTLLFNATDDETGREVHLKLVRPDLTGSQRFRDRFDDRMRAAAAMSHPNIAAIYDWGMTPFGATSVAFVVIERLNAGSLRDLFDRGRRLSPSQALAVGLDACKALDYAHRRGQIHGEISPSKLVFGDDRRLRIVDFGLASLLGEQIWTQPDMVPTHQAWYAAPEQGGSEPITAKIDIYALCLSLNEAVTGELPFKSDSTVNTLANRVGRLLPVSAELGPLAAVFERAGRPEPDERSSASEFGRELVRAASKLPRPEPLPLLSTGLFDMPTEKLRQPDDPTGGVERPEPTPPEAPVIIEAQPDAPASPEQATVSPAPDEGLRIRPLDTPDASDSTPTTSTPATSTSTASGESGQGEHPESVDETEAMPIAPTESSLATADQQEGPDSARRPWVGVALKTLLGLAVIAALVAIGLVASRLFSTTTHTVPNLIGVDEGEALNVVSTNSWVVSVENERSDDVPDVGSVVRTEPEAGVELAEGEPFVVIVSAGPELRELPDSTGLPLAEAQSALRGLDLDVDAVEEFHEEVPTGDVISWSVPSDPTLSAGAGVEPDTQVELVVSKGPEPRVVPDLSGTTVEAARTAVENLQLEFAIGGEEFNDDVPEGAIIRQDAAAESELERGATITVVVSKGVDLVPFPDMSSANNYDQAQKILAEAGFTPRLALGDDEGSDLRYQINGAEPNIGQTFKRGTQVDVLAI